MTYVSILLMPHCQEKLYDEKGAAHQQKIPLSELHDTTLGLGY